jgi:hypothetical protein
MAGASGRKSITGEPSCPASADGRQLLREAFAPLLEPGCDVGKHPEIGKNLRTIFRAFSGDAIFQKL